MSSFPEGRGQSFVRSVAAPAVGAGFEIVGVAGWVQRIWGFRFGLTTDANVGDRYVAYTIQTLAVEYYRHVSTVAHTATVAGIYTVGTSAITDTNMLGWYFVIPWHPEYLLTALTYIRVFALNMQVGDAFSIIDVLGEEWIDD